uniref:Uncharacterized protein n=1 Tax=viral metagenome TaxID=1070528 RepID=A0A6C0I671_9ZZZZ
MSVIILTTNMQPISRHKTNIRHNSSSNPSNKHKEYNVVEDLQDYMFTSENLSRFTKDIFIKMNPKSHETQNYTPNSSVSNSIPKHIQKHIPKTQNNNIYKPLKKDSLFWCFYILKYGFSKYEMEVGSQYFTVEKNEKFKYIELLRGKENKDLLKINKIKPLSELEDDLANKDKISVKTFFALCIIEKMNVLLVDKRKIYQSMNNDSPEINVIHRNSDSFEHHIELNVSNESISNYKDNYYNVSGFDNVLKSMSSYKVDELLELCKKLNIVCGLETAKKKLTKKDIYELIVKNF